MLFVHLIYVLANYIGVLVLLAEKCQVFFFFPVCWLLSKQKKSDDDITTEVKKIKS